MEQKKKENKIMQVYKSFSSKHKRLCEIIRFVIVGGLATVIDYLIMGIVLYLFDPSLYPKFYNVWFGGGDPTTLATVVGTGLGFAVSLVFNYLLSVFFVYEDKGNSKTAKGAVLFIILSIGGLLLNMLGMWIGYDLIGINEWITKIVMTIVVLFYNYLTRKLFIFKKDNSKSSQNDLSSAKIDIANETEISEKQ